MKSPDRRPLRFVAALALVTGIGTAWYAWAQQPPPVTPTADAAPPVSLAPPSVEPRAEPIVVEVQAGEEGNVIIHRTTDGKIVRTMTAKGPGGYAAGGSYGPPHLIAATAADPEVAKLLMEEQEAAKESQDLVRELRDTDDEAKRKDVSEKLRDSLNQQFDAQQKRRAHEVSKIEERLAKLKDTMKKREAAKEQIVGRRLDELSGVMDELGWEETFGPRRPPNVPGGGFPPGVVPAYPDPVPAPARSTLPRTPGLKGPPSSR
jgi:hypothetical protein